MTTGHRPALRRAALLTATVCLATLASLSVADIALHVFGERPIVASEWLLARPEQLDDEVVFCDPAYRTDAHYRVAERPLVAFLGDSFTYGYPVAREDSYPKVLAERLVRRGRTIGSIVLGVGDGGPDQELRLFERHLLPRVRPDVVVWQLFPNDEFDNVSKAVYGIDAGRLVLIDASRNWIIRRQRLYDHTPARERLRRDSYIFRTLLKGFERWQLAAVPVVYRDEPRRWGLEKIRMEIDRMNELAREHAFRAYFLLVAPQSLYLTGDAGRLPTHQSFVLAYRRLYDLVARQPAFIDARFYGRDGVTLRSDIFADGTRDSSAGGNRHFNEEGYRLLAELVLERLKADGVLD